MLKLYFFFNDTAATEIYTLSLHDALPISGHRFKQRVFMPANDQVNARASRQLFILLHGKVSQGNHYLRSEEHTSELQSQSNLVCRLLLEKKNKHEHHRF